MLFTHSSFLFYFLPLALLIHGLCLDKKDDSGRYPNRARIALLVLTLIYYGSKTQWWLAPFIACLFLNYLWAVKISQAVHERTRKIWLWIGMVQNLGLLAFFKYPLPIQSLSDLVLPAGISFYTFESLSFLIDVYRRQVQVPKNPLEFFVFLAMFPRFIAGPIVRYKDMVAQFNRYRGMQLSEGLFIFIVGLSLKSLFADSFAVFVEYGFGRNEAPGFLSAWIGVIAYAMQIYFDFSGYSLMAIGLGRAFGFQFPSNFNRPYLATSMRDFWTRWHMSFTNWIRDYLYTPLALWAMRRSRWHFALVVILTVVLSGIWHGAGWTFVIWGAWHGFLLCFERIAKTDKRLPKFARWPLTAFFILISWVFFRAADIPEVGRIFSGLFNPAKGHFNPELLMANQISAVFCALGFWYCFVGERLFSQKALEQITLVPLKAQVAAFGLFVIALIMSFSSWSIPFLYFQF